ncbi:MAG TPA: 2-dehydropantoate 2-reductase N-terminal domain-containing protein, partial [Candidatus Sulfotelmatobacter sp.]
MKHAILGAGAVGGLIGAALGHEGEDVTLLVRPEATTRSTGTPVSRFRESANSPVARWSD